MFHLEVFGFGRGDKNPLDLTAELNLKDWRTENKALAIHKAEEIYLFNNVSMVHVHQFGVNRAVLILGPKDQ